ncbi:MAG: DegT/DnrJ/EryC1/StrS family aminotransferase [Clostridia bacterium]|nr:DegT/DnrJ/EryC1/StrS family aminotransferase [Clostridia bacterium]
MDPKALEKAFEKYPETRGYMLVHLYGMSAKLDEIHPICNQHGAVLIEGMRRRAFRQRTRAIRSACSVSTASYRSTATRSSPPPAACC